MQLGMAPQSHKLAFENRYQGKVKELTELNISIKNMRKDAEKEQFLTDVNELPLSNVNNGQVNIKAQDPSKMNQ